MNVSATTGENVGECQDEYDVQGASVNPFCHRPAGHVGGHAGVDPFGVHWTWSYDAVAAATNEGHDWRRLALHALADLSVLGVPIDRIIGVDEDVLCQVEEYQRGQTAFS